MLAEKGAAGNADVSAFLGHTVSRFTVLRDPDFLVGSGLIKKEGKGRAVRYRLAEEGLINRFFNPEEYFKNGPDERAVKTDYDPAIIGELPHLFSQEEVKTLEGLNAKYKKKLGKISEASFFKELFIQQFQFAIENYF